MSRTKIAVGVFVLVLVVLTVRRAGWFEKAEAESPAVTAEKARVRQFWETYHQATTLRTERHFAEAAGAYRRVLEQSPGHEDSLYYLGVCSLELGDYQAAEANFRRLAEMNPASGRAYAQLGNTLAVLAPGSFANFSAARGAYLKNVEVNREQAGPFLNLGLLDLNEGRWREAEAHFRTAANAGSPDGKVLLGYSLMLDGRPAEATPLFRAVLDAYKADKSRAAKGVLSEGDVVPDESKPLGAQERAALRAMVLGYWNSGDRPPGLSHPSVQSQAAPHGGAWLPTALPTGTLDATRLAAAGLKPQAGRAAFADFEHIGTPGLVVTGMDSRPLLYRLQHGRAVDITEQAGMAGVAPAWDARWADVDGDGWSDLYLLRPGFSGTGRNQLFLNKHGSFTDATARSGLGGERSTLGACFFDADGDRQPDLLEVGAARAGARSVRFFRNLGGRFAEQTETAGLASEGTAVDCATADYDRDGRTDVFIQFWRRNAVLYRNAGERFEDATERAGLRGVGSLGLSSVFLDYDRDGAPDLLVTAHAPYEEAVRSLLRPQAHSGLFPPRLFHNAGGRFEDVTARTGLAHSYGTMQALAADLDGDGWPDIVLANGSLDAQRAELSVVLRNVRGERFELWGYLPGSDRPANFIGAATTPADSGGKRYVYVAANPRLARFAPSGLFELGSR